ncbi:conserved protein of unknown function [Pseudorhizobium banfieldiae]|uniref:DUF2892 domain-containing protein n=1 Tax=Pseudorhizobium banfieldiae TaxID=1125847 RepID=L0NJ82_9HYPH|nr:hypothetical protein [Pseudorhizobium banfieldiae]CAD6615839.1 hypothetical protein RNT25_02967 [arsenite-oxidising bacterium NT-25]CAD6618765.1 hypothetical protein RTCK_03691 [Rhizobium sp. TCK]CCF20352.1 conserved protein of unknown function [Pseudorhizobium banfieldiae]
MATTANRVSAQTSDEINRRLRWQMEERLAYYEAHPDQIDARLAELGREWDVERTLEANASTLAFTGTVLAATVDRRWLALPAIVTGFLFQHAVQGWCPPLPILRRLGFRTAEEINQERYALKALRGDFEAKDGNRFDAVLRAVGLRRGSP